MLDFAIETWRNAFSWLFSVWSSIELSDGVTIWSMIIAGFLSFGLVSVVISRFGGSITSDISSITTKYTNEAQNRNRSKQNNLHHK